MLIICMIMTIFTYTSWRTNIMKKKITKEKITEEDKAEFNEAVGFVTKS